MRRYATFATGLREALWFSLFIFVKECKNCVTMTQIDKDRKENGVNFNSGVLCRILGKEMGGGYLAAAVLWWL
jgi:hypothetical protein